MRGLNSQRWAPEDRKRLAELAAIHDSDYTIARIMVRKASAVSWQRRYLRIRLSGKSNPPGCAAWLENVNQPFRRKRRTASDQNQKKKPVSNESGERVERLMRLAERMAR